MYKIGVIGDKDSVLSFKSIGIDVFPVGSSRQAGEILDQIAEKEYAVIYITEQAAKDIRPVIEKYNDRMLPAVILVPGSTGSLGIGMEQVKKTVEKAVGADIL